MPKRRPLAYEVVDRRADTGFVRGQGRHDGPGGGRHQTDAHAKQTETGFDDPHRRGSAASGHEHPGGRGARAAAEHGPEAVAGDERLGEIGRHQLGEAGGQPVQPGDQGRVAA
jgi:hypothetical protein